MRRNTNHKFPTGTNEFNEVRCVIEFRIELDSSRWIATKRQDVRNISFGVQRQNRLELGSLVPDAGEVRHGQHQDVLANVRNDLVGAVPGRPARPVRDADKVGAQ